MKLWQILLYFITFKALEKVYPELVMKCHQTSLVRHSRDTFRDRIWQTFQMYLKEMELTMNELLKSWAQRASN